MAIVKDVLRTLDAEYSLSRAAKWDKVGLQIGDANARVEKVFVAHEITDDVLSEAEGAQAMVVYHPLLFRALENLDFVNHTARLAARCIAQNLNVIAVHTALDHALPPRALGDKLAQTLGLQDVGVLQPDGHEELCKIVVFVPDENLRAVQDAMWQAGAGQIGNYDCASFRARGTGTFRPNENAHPHSGEIGTLEQADEWRLEVIAPRRESTPIIAAMKAAHPYEEVAYDVFDLQNRDSNQAFGAARVGALAGSTPMLEYARDIAAKLNAPGVRLIEAKTEIQKIACVPGSGASFIAAAARAGCDCLVSGDFKHHDALQAQALGLSLIDVTHVATEAAAVPMMAAALGDLGIEIVQSERKTNPFAAL